jgi:CRISPR/Cas system-associated exonuclease Cas4 (RecB family)
MTGALRRTKPSPETEELLDTLEAIPVERIPEGLDPEVAIAWNLRTDEARFLGSGIGRDYARHGVSGPDWIVGTADLLGQTEDGQHLIVPDYKTGVMRQRAKHSRQLSTLALLASKLTGIRSAHVSNLYIGRKGKFRPDLAELGPFDLDAQEQRLRELPAQLASAKRALASGHLPDLAVGEQCRYCPSVLACPTHTEAVRGFIHPASLTRLVQRLPECSADELKSAVVMWDLSKRHLKRLEKALKLEADHEPIALDGGMEYRRVATSRTDFTEAGQAELEALKSDLKARGETVERTIFKHVVAAARAPIVPALRAFDGDAADDEEG